jgi:hypothetical protein
MEIDRYLWEDDDIEFLEDQPVRIIQSFVDIQGGLNPNQSRDDKGRWGEGAGDKRSADPYEESSAYKNESYTPQQRKALIAYTGEGNSEYEAINGGLRRPPPTAKAKGRIADIESAFENAPVLSEDTVVYRGMISSQKFKKGDSISDKGFMSTSLDEDVAIGFTTKSKKNAVLFKITVKKGTPFIKMGKWESEILFKNGSKMKITSIQRSDMGSDIEAVMK